jgi:adenine-specific DNA-methyltransferase
MVDFPERMTLESANVTDERLDALRSVFPEVFREGKVDFDALKRSLGENVDSGPERFGLTWPGKAECARVIQTPSVGTLLPMKEESVDWDTTQNVIIEGENLEVLKLLQKAYYGKVKLIYIDPPYNTGKEFVYPDNFKEGLADYLKYSGQVDGEGQKLSANTDTDGRYHSKWLSMMYPRLFLARNLLREDGVIFVSIDDHEVHHLRELLDDLFGAENFIATIAVQLNPRGRNLNEFIAQTHEYIMVFGRDVTCTSMHGVSKEGAMVAEYRASDDRGAYREIELRNRNPAFNSKTRPTLFYGIWVDPLTGAVSLVPESPHWVEVYPLDSSGRESCWTWSKQKLQSEVNRLQARAVGDGFRIFRRDYLFDEDGEIATTLPKSIWMDAKFNNDVGKKAIRALLGEVQFDFPKSPDLLRSILRMASAGDDLVFDFFAGSGTTAEAVIRQNLEDGMKRKFVLVQLPSFSDETGQEVLASLVRRRASACALSLRDNGSLPGTESDGDTGFRSYRLSSSNFLVWDGTSKPAEQLQVGLGALAENVVAGRTQDDLAVELLLKLGFPMNTSMSTEVIAGKTVYSAADGAVMFFLDDRISIEIIEWMVERDPARIVVLEAAFGGDDELKVNAVQTVRAKAAGKQSEMVLKVV